MNQMQNNVNSQDQILDESKQVVANLAAMQGVPLSLRVVLGEAKMKIKDLLALGEGSIVDLNKKVGEPVEV